MKRKMKTVKPQYQTHFQMKNGDHFHETDPSSRDWPGYDSFIFYVISREEVEACHTSRLLHDLRTEIGNPLFESGPGSVIFSVHGYGEDPRDLLQIPEFRSFIRKVQQSCPCWLYFAMPGNRWLRIILAASTVDCRLEAKDGKLRIAIANSQIAEFMAHQLREYERLLKQKGIESCGIDDHVYATMHDSFPGLLPPSTHN